MPEIADSVRRALAGETVSYVAQVGEAVFESWVSPLRDESGDIVGATGVSTDVTDRHTAERRLAQAERLATVGMLAAGVAHEINNPLAYVIGNLDLLAQELAEAAPPLPAERLRTFEAAVRDARQGAERVRTIVRDLKVFSRVQEDRPTLVDVGASIEAALGIAHNEIRHRARLVMDLAPVPPVKADAGRLAQLFLNLIINAAQAIPEGAAEKNEIRIATRLQKDGWVCVEVKDTGSGIPRQQLAKIFDPFFTTKSVGAGTGLGLSIVHAIVTAAGGRIEVESTPGEGSLFRVAFPPGSDAEEPKARAVPAPATPGRRGKVLVIDDEPLILKVVTSLLAPEHEVVCESRGTDAIQRIRGGQRFDAILCDLMMPDATGMDVYEGILQIAPREAMLFLTGGAFTARAQQFLERVPNSTVEKPFDGAALKARVRKLVG